MCMHHNIQQLSNETNPDKEKIMADYQSRLRGTINAKNLGLYVKAFMK